MIKLPLTIAFIFLASLSFGQTPDVKAMVDSLRFLKPGTLDCKADLYWRIIAQREKAIPYLIDKLTDTTLTNISFHCKQTKLNVAEVAYEALDEIAYFPMALMTDMQFDVIHNGCWSFYDYFYSNYNKPDFQKMVKEWYSKNIKKYHWEFRPVKTLTDCQIKYQIYTYYQWAE